MEIRLTITVLNVIAELITMTLRHMVLIEGDMEWPWIHMPTAVALWEGEGWLGLLA